MTRRPFIGAAALGLLIVASAILFMGATPKATPTPAPEPVFELHRTAAASHSAPAKANPLFVLVIGSDVRSGEPAAGRADSLHIVAVNTTTGTGTVLGFPRDSYVPIPGRGRSKINDALVAGGPSKVVETITANTGIPIHYWALVDFSRFVELADRLGGVDIDVPYRMYDTFSGADFVPGRRHMNGTELLAFCRNRHGPPGGDIGRSENQGRALLAGLAKFRTEASDPFGMLKFAQAFHDLVLTDVPISDLLHLGAVGRRLDPGGFRNVIVPSRTGQAGSASVVFWEPSANAVFAGIRDDGVL